MALPEDLGRRSVAWSKANTGSLSWVGVPGVGGEAGYKSQSSSQGGR